jgi:hypothetical protein
MGNGTMLLSSFFIEQGDFIWISAEQASRFAKTLCADFNPIHDPDAKRFCVPGDLLFALVLKKYGLSQEMSFKFVGRVDANTKLHFPVSELGSFTITDEYGKEVLIVEHSPEKTQDTKLIEAITRRCVAFSGQNFPKILMPLMKQHDVMFNPARPLVMYDSMWFKLDNLAFSNPDIELHSAQLHVKKKRANEMLNFNFLSASDGEPVGRGVKKVVLGGLKPFDEASILAFAKGYAARRKSYQRGFFVKSKDETANHHRPEHQIES